jgi:hypothetical protein
VTRDLSRCNYIITKRLGSRPACKFACQIKISQNLSSFLQYLPSRSFPEVFTALKELTL